MIYCSVHVWYIVTSMLLAIQLVCQDVVILQIMCGQEVAKLVFPLSKL